MIKTTIRLFSLLTLCLFLVSWGSVGHKIISNNAPSFFSPAMTGFNVWADSLMLHASDADTRKGADKTESPKHFIDIDNYTEFISKGRIVSTYDSLVALHGATNVTSNGILPYATRTTYDSLKNCFKKLQWHNAMLFASDLGHYVGDGHMPMHITANFDGQKTGNDGVHSRYESDMVYAYQSNLSDYSGFVGTPVTTISNVNNYIFAYIYRNYRYKDSVLLADTYAKIQDPSYGPTYLTGLWNKTQFTKTLFHNASHALAELIYSAWKDAGSPPFGSKTFISAVNTPDVNLISVFPNPTKGIIQLSGDVVRKVQITSIDGKLMGSYNQNQFDISSFPNGLYLVTISGNDGFVQRQKIILAK
jgi:hypothetical protein